VVREIQEYIGPKGLMANVLDVGCGTGLSTTALRGIAENIMAVDISQQMLAVAPRDDHINYVVSTGEDLPIGNGRFDMVTVSSSFHWLDRSRFLPEAVRVLRPRGWLVIYDNYFLGKMVGNPKYEDWSRSSYLERYPSPPRDRRPVTRADATSYGLDLVREDTYTNDVSFSLDQLVSYLLTQTNVIDAIEKGDDNVKAVTRWLEEELRELFLSPRATFPFAGPILYFRK
jgi:SAM-dependent methyltransferase